MVKYRRIRLKGGTYFFTVALQNRNSTLLFDEINKLRSAFSIAKQKYPFFIDGIVIMPDHIHTMWTLPEGDYNYSRRWQCIKSVFIQLLKNEIKISAPNKKGEYNIWQKRFWEHTIQHELDYQNHIQYIHYNPVKHGYVQHVKDWPYSSFHQFVRNKKLSLEWGSNINIIGKFGE